MLSRRPALPQARLPPLCTLGLAGAETPAMLDWQETIAWLRDKIKAPALTLRLIVIEDSDPDRLPKWYCEAGARGAPETLLEAYMALIGPLKQLAEGPDGLARSRAVLRRPSRPRAGAYGGAR